MSDYYDNTDFWHDKGVDYDLLNCLEYNPQETFTEKDIDRVLAVYEGQNEGEDWRWIILLNDGQYVYLRGGCDYTGWDCQSWASSTIDDDPFVALQHEQDEDLPVSADNNPVQLGMMRMLTVLTGEYNQEKESVYALLEKQLQEGKNKTWREKKDIEFGLAKDETNDA
jgi:hypothetical protein